jgi:hypothetical protein
MRRRCELVVFDGEVACPNKGRISIELCYRCSQLRAFYDDDDGTKMVCTPARGVRDGHTAALAGATPKAA